MTGTVIWSTAVNTTRVEGLAQSENKLTSCSPSSESSQTRMPGTC